MVSIAVNLQRIDSFKVCWNLTELNITETANLLPKQFQKEAANWLIDYHLPRTTARLWIVTQRPMRRKTTCDTKSCVISHKTGLV